MTSKSSILEELKREEMSLTQELSRVKPQQAGRAVGRRVATAGVSEEEKKEIRKAKSRIAYKKRQLAQASGAPLQRVQEYEDRREQEPVPQRPQAPKRGRQAPAKKSLPPPPSGPQSQGSGVQMVYVPGDQQQEDDDLGYEESVECEDDGGFEP